MSKVLPRLRSLNELVGTPYYTAPEIIKGEYAHGADMWSVGVIMFVMLFGFPPFYVDPNKFYGKSEAVAIYELIQKGFTPEVKQGYGPWFPDKIPVSNEARDLMGKLLEMDRAKRMTAKEALLHPWIKNNGNKQVQKNDATLTKEIFGEFVKFTNNCNFKLAVVQIFRNQFEQMRPQHFQQLKTLFEKLDKDKKGRITYQQFEDGLLELSAVNLTKEQIKSIFSELDVKDKKEIAFEELLNAAVHDYLVASDERLYQVFRELDNDEDGIIKTEELKAKLKESDPYNRYDDLVQLINDADLDNDGNIDYEEFLRALHPNFNETPDWFWTAQNKEKKQ